MRNVRLLLGLCTALALACTADAPEPPGTGSTPADTTRQPSHPTPLPPSASPDEAALRELSDRFVRGVLAGNADTVASAFSREADAVLPGKEEALLGQQAIRDHFAKRFERAHVTEFEVERSYVVRPELAYSFGVWRAVGARAGGGIDSSSGHLTDIYRRDGTGPWVVLHEHASLIAPTLTPRDSLATPF